MFITSTGKFHFFAYVEIHGIAPLVDPEAGKSPDMPDSAPPYGGHGTMGSNVPSVIPV
jgi:hypothetical protein